MLFRLAKISFLLSTLLVFGVLGAVLSFQLKPIIFQIGFYVGSILGIAAIGLFAVGLVRSGISKPKLSRNWIVYVAFVPWCYWAIISISGSFWP
jgi:hypothetical protein